MYKIKRNRLAQLAAIATVTLLPKLAFASGDIVTTVVYNICDWLSGPLAVAMGILVCIAVGYSFISGHIDKVKLIFVLIGLGLIIGGAYFAKSILLSGVV